MVGEILQGLVAVGDGLVALAEVVQYWRFWVCFTPAIVLALVLWFTIPDRIVSITAAALILTLAGTAGKIWHETSRSSLRSRNGK